MANRKPKKQTYPIAAAALWGAACFMGSLAVAGWTITLWDQSPIFAAFIGTGFGVSALVTPMFVGKVAHATGTALCGMILVCVVFGAIDALGTNQGFKTIERLATQPAFDKAQAKIDAALIASQTDITTAKITLTNAQASLDAVPLPSATGTIRNRDTWNDVMSTMTKARDEAKAEVERLEAKHATLPTKAVRGDLFNDTYVAVLSGLIQFVLAIGFIALEATAERRYQNELAAWDKKQKKTQRKRRRTSKSKPRQASNVIPLPVAANDG